MSEHTRLVRPVAGAELPALLEKLIRNFLPDFSLVEIPSGSTEIKYESHGVSIRRQKQEHSYEDSYEPWWPTSHWWECYITGIPGVEEFALFAGTSSPDADEVYNYFSLEGETETVKKFGNKWRAIQIEHVLRDKQVAHSILMPQQWQDFFMTKRHLEFSGAFDWLKDYDLAQGEDQGPLVFECEGKNWLATTDMSYVVVRGAIPADRETVKETRQRTATGADPKGIDLAAMLLPDEAGWSEFFPETTDVCFLGTAWGDQVITRAWSNARWLMRQSIGGNKWGGMRSVYWLQPIEFAEAARFSLIAMFEIYGGGPLCPLTSLKITRSTSTRWWPALTPARKPNS